MFAVLIAVAMIGQNPDVKLSESIRNLASDDRLERHDACEALKGARSLPESAIEPILSYLKLEVEQAMIPTVGVGRAKVIEIPKLPVVGDEVSIARIKANPDRYIGKSFILAGVLSVSDYYNFGFRDEAANFYSFSMDTADLGGRLGADSVPIYLSRFDGAVLAELVTKIQERKIGVLAGVRLRCKIHRERLEGDLSHAADSIEATDWQVLAPDGKSWMPWTFESIAQGYRLLFLTGKASTAKCLDLIMDEQTFQGEKPDLMLKGTAIMYILGLPAKDRSLVLKRIPPRAKRTKSAVARRWAQRAFNSLTSGRLVL
jgi:hypothetical protein